MKWSRMRALCVAVMLFAAGISAQAAEAAAKQQIAYIAAKSDLPFWKTVAKGVRSGAAASSYSYLEFDSKSNPQQQLKNAQDAIAQHVSGIILSPIDSKSAVEVAALAQKAKIPLVIAEVGSDSVEYLAYVRSDHFQGAYDLGVILAGAMKDKGWSAGSFAMVTMPLNRRIGQDRSNGLRDALKDAGISKESELHQMQNFSADETAQFVKNILAVTPTLRALFIQNDQAVPGALQAIKNDKKSGDVLIVSFDAMPDVADMLKYNILLAVAMQQPYLIGVKSAEALIAGLSGNPSAQQILVPVLVGTSKNIAQIMPIVNKTVFGND